MPEDTARRRAALDRLLVERTTEGLEPSAEAELATLLEDFPEVDAEGFERAAAAIWLAASRPAEPMPRGLRERIIAGAMPANGED